MRRKGSAGTKRRWPNPIGNPATASFSTRWTVFETRGFYLFEALSKTPKFCVVRLYSRYSPTLDNLFDGFDNLQAGQGQYDEGRQPQPPPEQIGIQAGMSGHE